MLPPRRPRVVMSCLLALASLTPFSRAQNVTTWHNDNNRTGWQQVETALKPSTVSTNFGLLWQWSVSGHVFAQPLAVANVPTNLSNCNPSCNLVFISTEMDMLYAFNAASSSQTPVWSLNLAGQVTGGTAVDCNNLPNGVVFGPCDAPSLKNSPIGVTGTPVIDTTSDANNNTLYVVGAVQVSSVISYYLFAVNITTGLLAANPLLIGGSVSGQAPPPNEYCASTNPQPGNTVSFVANYAIQRSALLLLNGLVYVAFAPYPENYNGWMFGYQLSQGSLSQTAIFNSTPYGTGGGIWGSGAGPASDGSSIYVATGNGTFSYQTPGPPTIPINDFGDSLLKLNPSTLAVSDYYTPSDVFTYPPPNGTGLCLNDADFASGGVLLIPAPFTYNRKNVVVNADKQSNLYVADQANLGQFSSSGGNNIQVIQTPNNGGDLKREYWASPAYWHYNQNSADHYMLYYSVTTDKEPNHAPLSINGYTLSTSGSSGPISSTYASTPILFCQYSPTPSVSSNLTASGTGIVWAIENPNTGNPINNNCAGTTYLPAALHAFNAASLSSPELYSSRGLQTHIGYVKGFPTPTVFKGQVYMGTTTGPNNNLPGVDVFGLCSTVSTGCLQ
jgi:hypothetical protein